MSNKFDFVANVLEMTRDELLEAMIAHVDDTVGGEYFYKNEDAADDGIMTGRITLYGHMPNMKEPVAPGVAYLKLSDAEDDFAKELPEVWVKVTFEVVEQSMPDK